LKLERKDLVKLVTKTLEEEGKADELLTDLAKLFLELGRTSWWRRGTR
jgi:hypothetical protein